MPTWLTWLIALLIVLAVLWLVGVRLNLNTGNGNGGHSAVDPPLHLIRT